MNVSLKGNSAQWSGMDLQTDLGPSEGQFTLLKNCYVTKDGTEIRRIPGWGLVGRPNFMEPINITALTVGSPTTIQTTSSHGLATGDYVRVVGNTTTGMTDDKRGYVVTVTAHDIFTIPVATSGASAVDGSVYCARLYGSKVHGFRQTHGHTVVVAEDKFVYDSSAQNIKTTSGSGTVVTVTLYHWHGHKTGDTWSVDIAGTGDPVIDGNTYTVTANGWSGFTLSAASAASTSGSGTATWDWEIPYIAAWVTDTALSLTSPPDLWDYWKSHGRIAGDTDEFYWIPRKSCLDINAAKVVWATPGYGCCWEADLGHRDFISLAKEFVHSLGVPKAMIVESTTVPNPGSGTWGTVIGATVYVSVAYRDIYTGETGLLSDPFKITGVGATDQMDFSVLRPREVMREASMYCDLLVFAGASPAAMQVVHIENSTGMSTNSGRGKHDFTVSTPYPQPGVPQPVGNLMPPESKFLSTLRGWTLGGGSLYPALSANAEAVTSAPQQDNRQIKVSGLPSNLAGEVLAHAYQGIRAYNLPGQIDHSYLSILMSGLATATKVRNYEHIWKTEAHFMDGTGSYNTMSLMPMRGQAWHSEQGEPGVSPGVNSIIFDRVRGEDLEGAGRVGDSWVVCTKSESFLLSPGDAPRTATPQRLSETFGCVSSNAFVEFDGGLAWLSNRGPVAFRGQGLEWIGREVEPLWTDLLRDSESMMPHAIGGHDPERCLVYFGVRKDVSASTYSALPSDDDKSKIGCDYFLVWSYKTGAWSVWQPPENVGAVYDMFEVRLDDGSVRLAFLAGSDWYSCAIYAFDDDYFNMFDGTAAHIGVTLDSTAVGATNTYFYADTVASFPSVEVGMDWFIEDVNGFVKLTGSVPTLNSDTRKLDLGISYLGAAGDRIFVGCIDMEITTKKQRFSGRMDGPSQARDVVLRHTIHSPTSGGGSGTPKGMTLKATLGDVPVTDSAITGDRTRSGKGIYNANDVYVNLKVYGDGRLGVKDIEMEVAARE